MVTDELTQAELMNDFATEEFINKNIRVRPVSGITVNPDEKSEMKPMSFEGDDEEENAVREANYLLD